MKRKIDRFFNFLIVEHRELAYVIIIVCNLVLDSLMPTNKKSFILEAHWMLTIFLLVNDLVLSVFKNILKALDRKGEK